jgi:hypothetical protein
MLCINCKLQKISGLDSICLQLLGQYYSHRVLWIIFFQLKVKGFVVTKWCREQHPPLLKVLLLP